MNKYKSLYKSIVIAASVLLLLACNPYARTENPVDDGYSAPHPYKHWGQVSDELNLEQKGRVEAPIE